MKKINPTLPKGTRDFGPIEMKKRDYLLNIFKDIFSSYGFSSIETPSIENMEVLNGKYGEEGDKLIFRILDSGDFLNNTTENDIKDSSKLKNKISTKGLRYDLTVPLARYVSMNRDKISLPFKRYQIQKVWRADRPQKGRFREFYQCDVDYIGSKSILCEAEIIDLVYTIFDRLQLNDFTIKLNNRKILFGISEVLGFTNQFDSFCILVDKIDKIGKEKFNDELIRINFSERIINKLNDVLFFDESIEKKIIFLKTFLSNSKKGLEGLDEISKLYKINPNFEFDLSLARGLSYYTSTIFEVILNNEKIGSVCGGGRYDDLTEIFGYKNISGIGISFGIERIYEIMNEKNLFQSVKSSKGYVMISCLSEKYLKKCLEISSILRKNKIIVDLYSDSTKLKKQLQYANNNSIPYVIMIGEKEINSELYTIKKMDDGSQEELSLEKIITKVLF